jgi:hypothetical protein
LSPKALDVRSGRLQAANHEGADRNEEAGTHEPQ